MPSVKIFYDERTVKREAVFNDIPVDVGVAYEGERIRRPDLYVEFGGVKTKYKFEILRVRSEKDVEDGKIVLIGPDIPEFPEGSRYQPLAIIVEVWGEELKDEYESVFERRLHFYMNWIQGIMHTGQREDIWIRIGKKAVKQGLRFEHVGKVIMRLYKADFPIIKKIQVTFITDQAEVEKRLDEAIKVYRARDERVFGLKDEDVDTFYGCVLCQSFAPTHVCVITPERPANCGAITWIDAKVAALIDPKGPIFPIPKGKLLDPEGGEYDTVNEAVKLKSQGTVTRVKIYSALEYPHTVCGCFEAVVFYMPEVNGFGIVSRKYTGRTPIGLTFVQIADMISGGRQISGFCGIGILYLRSRKFLQKDGGWERVVWMDSETKERVKEWIPKELVDKIATEKEAETIDQLREFLIKVNHPIVKTWKVEEVKPAEVKPVEVKPEEKPAIPMIPPEELPKIPALPTTPISIKCGNVKIKIGKIVIRKK